MAGRSPGAGAHSIPIGAGDRVLRLASCHLTLTREAWPYAIAHQATIDAHWARRSRENPAMFNGTIVVLGPLLLDGEHLDGTFMRTDFKSYLHWREQGFPAAGVRDAFGSALIRSAEGHVILGRQGEGHLNAGRAYLPGGFIDPRDLRLDDRVDIDGSILRELAEETGIAVSEAELQPGYIATFSGALLSFARELRSPLGSAELAARIRDHIARDAGSELTEPVIVRDVCDLDGLVMAPYAVQLLKWYFTT